MENRIRQERVGKKWTQAQLAEKAGVSRVTIRNWEAGKRSVPSKVINDMCDWFDCSSDWLIGRSRNRT